MATRNGRYTLETHAAQIEAMAATLARIEEKLDKLAEWQRDVAARLAAGSVRFTALENDMNDAERKLEGRDNMQTAFSVAAAIIAGVIGSQK